MDLSEWIKVTSSFDHADFVTHSNYLKFVSQISSSLKLTCAKKIEKKISQSKKLEPKINLINLTLENLEEEFKTIKKYPEYSIVCVSWMPVKSYYIFFNLLIILEYLIISDENYLQTGHIKALETFKNLLKDRSIEFGVSQFNEIHASGNITGWKIPPWENVKRIEADPKIRYKQIIKKLFEYKKENFKREKKIERLTGKNKQDFMKITTVNLCEFFYWYRIKANYRDMQFIDKGVPTEDFESFYSDYFTLTLNFYSAMINSINNLSQVRFGKPLFN